MVLSTYANATIVVTGIWTGEAVAGIPAVGQVLSKPLVSKTLAAGGFGLGAYGTYHFTGEAVKGYQQGDYVIMVMNAEGALLSAYGTAASAKQLVYGPRAPSAKSFQDSEQARLEQKLKADLERKLQRQLYDELEEGGSFLMTKKQFEDFYLPNDIKTVGRPDGQFITSSQQMNKIIAEANGDPVKIAERLGMMNWSKDTVVYRMDMSGPLWYNPRPPSANMSGANSWFIPGGSTIGGVPEAVINQVPKQEVWYIIITPH